jgi:hypothetical protein
MSILVPIFIFAEDASEFLVKKKLDNSFITKYEYGKMLYNNPRGVSCKKCHGNNAKGIKISSFVHTYKNVKYNCDVKSSDITDVSRELFIEKLDRNTKVNRVNFSKLDICNRLIYGNTMPEYFLTNNEINSIYFYITNIIKNSE